MIKMNEIIKQSLIILFLFIGFQQVITQTNAEFVNHDKYVELEKDVPTVLENYIDDNVISKINITNATIERIGAVGFSIGNRGYIGTGSNDYGLKRDFWEYNPETDTWVQKADFGGYRIRDGVGFSIEGKGYVGTGYRGIDENEFWRYDPISDTWDMMAEFGGASRRYAVGYSIGSHGYIGTGLERRDGSNYAWRDLWEYDPGSNSWTERRLIPIPSEDERTFRMRATGFSIGNKGYIGTGQYIGNLKDFWEFDPSTNTWTQKADVAGIARRSAVGFSIGDNGYIGTGSVTGVGRVKDFWEYDPQNNTWTQIADFDGTARVGAVGFSIGNKGYVGTGWDGAYRKDFWEYDPNTNVWTRRADLGGDSFPEVEIVKFEIHKEHPELTDGMISPGETIDLKLTFKNNTDNDIQLSQIHINSITPGVDIEHQHNVPITWFIPANKSEEYPISIPVKLNNWPNSIESTKLKFSLMGYIGNEQNWYEPNEEYEIAIFIPEKELSIPEIQEQIAQGTLDYEELVATAFYPFFQIERDGGAVNGIKKSGQLLSIIGGIVGSSVTSILTDKAKSIALDYIISLVTPESSKYNELWTVAGLNHDGVEEVKRNLYFTNYPQYQWDVFDIGYPVKVIAKTKNILDYISTSSSFSFMLTDIYDIQEQIEAPLLEPLVFVYDTTSYDGYQYLSNPIYGDWEDKKVMQNGVVHQYWSDGNGGYYFSTISMERSPLLGFLTYRYICWTSDPNNVPAIGSTIKFYGTYKRTNERIPLPRHFGYISGPLRFRYIDIDEIMYFSGEASDLSRLEEQWFNIEYTEGPLSFQYLQSIDHTLNRYGDLGTNAFSIDETSHLHIYDSEGRHTGYIYDDYGKVVGINMEIPGTYYSGSTDEQFVIIENISHSQELAYQLHHRGDGIGSINMMSVDPSDTAARITSIQENIEIRHGRTSHDYIGVVSDDSTGIQPDISDFVVEIYPDTWEAKWINNDNATIDVFFYSEDPNYNFDNIDISTIYLFGQLEKIGGSGEIVLDENDNNYLRVSFSGKSAVEMLPSDQSGLYLVTLSYQLGDDEEKTIGTLVGLDVAVSTKEHDLIVTDYNLFQNYPNPFNPSTTIKFSLPERTDVNLEVYNTLGQRIIRLLDGDLEPGTHEITFDASHLPSGVYIYRLQAGEYVESRKMLYLR